MPTGGRSRMPRGMKRRLVSNGLWQKGRGHSLWWALATGVLSLGCGASGVQAGAAAQLQGVATCE